MCFAFFFFQAEDGIRDFCLSRGLGDVYKRQLYEKARAIYNAKIAEIELPRLAADGFNFRVAQPGIKIVEGKLYANSPIPQAEIRYTTDGSEPTATSTLWEAPVDCSASVVKAKLFYLGKESLTTDYKND